MDELTYKFNNNDTSIEIERKEFFKPKRIVFYVKDGDSIYVENNQEVHVNQLLVKKSNGLKYFSTISGYALIQGNSVIVTNDNRDEGRTSNNTLSLDGITKDDILNTCIEFGINIGIKPLIDEFNDSKKILIVNAIDIEPYLFNNRFLLQDNCKNTLDLLERISKLFNIVSYLVINKNDTNLVTLNSLISNYPNVRLHIITDKYPYNSNMFIIKKYFNEYSEKK